MPDPKPQKNLSPTPPAGYTLVPRDSSVPSFIRDAVGPMKEQVTPALKTDTDDFETIAEWNPGVISVYDPAKYTPQIRNHEMMHAFQDTRTDGSIQLPFGYKLPLLKTANSAPPKYDGDNLENYDYGGEAGLQALRNAHKTAANLNDEQQADVVADYKAKQDAYLAKVKAGKATPADLRQMYATHQAYHPFVQQMANMPKNLTDMLPSLSALLGIGKPQPLAPAPEAPGLPSYDTPGLGVAPADPLLGGQSQPIRPVGSHKIGETKRFPSGKIGTWDGHGWRLAQ